MNIIQKQLTLNQISLPFELIDIIKSYAFYNIMEKTKKIKNNIITLIKKTEWSSFNFKENLESDSFLFWIDDFEKSVQFQMIFCEKCGEYTTENTHEHINKIMCNC